MCGNKLLNRMGNLRRVFLGCSDARLLVFRNPNLSCLLSQHGSVGFIGDLSLDWCFGTPILGLFYRVCPWYCVFVSFRWLRVVGDMGGFAFGSHICFVP